MIIHLRTNFLYRKNFMEKLFIESWHNLCDITPDHEDVWFLLDGMIMTGTYVPESNIFVVADGDTIKGSDVYQWRCMTDKQVGGFPTEKEVVAVFIPELGIPAIGTYTDHYEDIETGDDRRAVRLYGGYEFDGTTDNSVAWEDVYYWYHLAILPEVIVDGNGETFRDTSIENNDFMRTKRTFLDTSPEPVKHDHKEDSTENSEKKTVSNGKSAIASYRTPSSDGTIKESYDRYANSGLALANELSDEYYLDYKKGIMSLDDIKADVIDRFEDEELADDVIKYLEPKPKYL